MRPQAAVRVAIEEDDSDGVLLQTFFRERNIDITRRAEQGFLPATAIALDLVLRAFHVQPKKTGLRMILVPTRVWVYRLGFRI